MLYLCLHLPALPLDIYTRHLARHFYQNQSGAKAIVDDNIILVADRAARDLGINPGMSVAEAKLRSATLQIQQRNTSKEQLALEELAHWIYELIATISIYPDNCLMLQLNPTVSLNTDVNSLIAKLVNGLNGRGYQSQYGLAHTPKAAYLVAKHYPDRTPHFDIQTGQYDATAFKHWLNQCPIAVLDQTKPLHNTLKSLAITSIGELMCLPVDYIGRHLGRNFLRYFAQLRGEISDSVPTIVAPQAFTRAFFFNNKVEHVGGLRFPIRRLLTELCDYLLQHQLQCDAIEWRLHASNGTETSLYIALQQQTADQAILLDACINQFEQQQLSFSVDQISLHCREFRSVNNGQSGQKIIQQGNVYTLNPSLARTSTSRSSGAEQMQLDFFTQTRPTWVLPVPEPIEQTETGLNWRGKLTLLTGPERIESQFQQHKTVLDYFVAQHENGETCWIFHNHLTSRWFAHGVFS